MVDPRCRTSAENGRIVITGTGRAGTTYLVQLFSALGFDTGFSPAEAIADIDPISHSGLERYHSPDDLPYVIKSPWLADKLADWLEHRQIAIYCAIVPMRDLFEAAESRRRVYHEAGRRGLDPLAHPGSLWLTRNPDEQEARLALQFYKLLFALVRFEIPIVFMEFPRLVRDPEYQFGKLESLMKAHGVDRSEFMLAHRRTARPDLIGTFETRQVADPEENQIDWS